MNGCAETPAWRRGRWLGLLLVVLGAQVALVFWLSDNRPIQSRLPSVAPRLQIAGPESFELRALLDPTLFALPHVQSFSGLAWLRHERPVYRPFEYSEPPRWLPLDQQELARAASAVAETGAVASLTLPRTRPELRLPPPMPSAIPAGTRWSLADDLGRRKLLTEVPIPSFPHTELLTNSVVQLMVTAEGRPASVTLLSSSGLAAADKQALETAARMRFAPLESNPAGLTWGKLIMEWHTLPATNAP
jgi:TonB family protein